MERKRIAIVGAGPVGLEAALYSATLGHGVTVFERGAVGQHVREWGHVRLFSPFALNHSSIARRTLQRSGATLPEDDEIQTGRDYV
ncbi:MAG: NAD-binding protein, partial [Acidobacteria bacterium]|nr:NAD-binding protein [Acidobacteriota bacterium]NIO60353.1 NAD-binding protein [Acidobacteriota bacterium]NIQ85566.1 NAD-binding protein [Acidobacteriota bacterium]